MVAFALVAALTAFADTPLPPNIAVSADLTRIVSEALRASPTLRQQSERIGRMRRVRVQIELHPPEEPSPLVMGRAYTNIRRYQFGLIIAAVRLISTHSAAALLAHELEHVSEYADGIDYWAASVRTPHAVWKTGRNTFETARAVFVERAVEREVRLSQARHLDR
jgi:hypothetical protein